MRLAGACVVALAALVATAWPAVAAGAPAPVPAGASAKAGAGTGSGNAGYVLTLDSRDSEKQAQSLSNAIRARTHGLPGWDFSEREISLEMVSAALRCPPRPDTPCLERIADSIHADRFMWGLVRRNASHQVAAEVHLWERGHAEIVVAEVYADQLVDPRDFVLRRLAGRIVDRLIGRPIAAVVTVRANGSVGTATDAEVVVDGAPAGPLTQGQAVLEVRPGHHAFEVRAGSHSEPRQEIDVEPGIDVVITFGTSASTAIGSGAARGSGKTLLGWGMVGLGVVAVAVGTVEALRFLSLRADNKDDHDRLRADDFCDASKPHGGTAAELSAACDRMRSASTTRTIELVAFGAGAVLVGAGAALLLTGKHHETAKGPIQIVPYAGARAGGLRLLGTF